MTSAIRVAALGALVLTALGARELRIAASDHATATETYEDVYYVPPPQYLPVFSLGYDEAVADMLWIRSLIYFGEELVQRGQVKHVFEYAEAILTLDPDFRRVYHWVASAGIYRPTETSVEDMYRATEFLERGVRRFPDDGEMAWDLGATLSYELVPRIDDPEEKERLRSSGVEHMQVAARLGAGPAWLALTNATQLRRLGRTEQALRHLEEMLATVDDPATKEAIEGEIRALRGAAHAEALSHALEEFERRRLAEYPYLPSGLFMLVREPAATSP